MAALLSGSLTCAASSVSHVSVAAGAQNYGGAVQQTVAGTSSFLRDGLKLSNESGRGSLWGNGGRQAASKLRNGRRGRKLLRSQAVSEEAAQSTAEAAVEDSRELEDATAEAPVSGAKEFFERFREAIVSEDETGIAEVQAQLEAMENDRSYLAQQVASLTEEVALGKDRFLRLNADFDNFRKRAEKEKVAMGVTMRAEVVSGLLPMIDNFERAKASIKVETEGEQKIDNSYQSIYKQFVDALKGMGVTAVETAGKEFDPNVHEAIMREESTAVPEGGIVVEFRKGFVIGEKLLRPAMVKVSAGPGPSSQPEAANASEASEEPTETESKSEQGDA